MFIDLTLLYQHVHRPDLVILACSSTWADLVIVINMFIDLTLLYQRVHRPDLVILACSSTWAGLVIVINMFIDLTLLYQHVHRPDLVIGDEDHFSDMVVHRCHRVETLIENEVDLAFHLVTVWNPSNHFLYNLFHIISSCMSHNYTKLPRDRPRASGQTFWKPRSWPN